MRLRILEELDQYIPCEGRTLDLGCGFGLFSLYFASQHPTRSMIGIDLNAGRIEAANRSAKLLGLSNVEYIAGDAVDQKFPSDLACVYTLDLLHHVPADGVPPLLKRIHASLAPTGLLLIKDVDTKPAYKRWFTLLLDRLMVGFEPIRYWSAEEMIDMLEGIGFQVYTHEIRDILPYPHRLYICRKQGF